MDSSAISKKLIELAPLLMRRVKRHMRRGSMGRLTHPQYRIMANIERGLRTVGEIADHHGVAQPSMSRTIDAMVDKGWIAREEDPRDRRRVRLSLTSEGRGIFLDVRRQARKELSDKIQTLSEKKAAALARAVEELDSILTEWDVTEDAE